MISQFAVKDIWLHLLWIENVTYENFYFVNRASSLLISRVRKFALLPVKLVIQLILSYFFKFTVTHPPLQMNSQLLRTTHTLLSKKNRQIAQSLHFLAFLTSQPEQGWTNVCCECPAKDTPGPGAKRKYAFLPGDDCFFFFPQKHTTTLWFKNSLETFFRGWF